MPSLPGESAADVATFRAGDVVVVNFPGVGGAKRRPAVVLSSAKYHASRPDVVIGLITSRPAAELAPTDFALQDWKAAGLRSTSAFRCRLATLPRSARIRVIGHLSQRDWQAVRRCVSDALELGSTETSGG